MARNGIKKAGAWRAPKLPRTHTWHTEWRALELPIIMATSEKVHLEILHRIVTIQISSHFNRFQSWEFEQPKSYQHLKWLPAFRNEPLGSGKMIIQSAQDCSSLTFAKFIHEDLYWGPVFPMPSRPGNKGWFRPWKLIWPLKSDHFSREDIWTNHPFSGDIR